MPPATAPGLDPAAFDAWVDRELAKELPSAVIAIADHRGLRWHRGIGSRDARGGPAPDRRTIYRIGSITKVLTGAAVLQLRDAGVLTLDDPVAHWIPELAELGVADPKVSIRHLVTHTAGIPGFGDRTAQYWQQHPPDRTELLRAISGPLEFVPGTRSEYSNAGMALAGEIVARAAGMSYRTYLAKHLLGPMGMRTAVWDRQAVQEKRLAIGVGERGAIDSPHWQLGAFEPAGGLYASLDDMVALARFALGGAPHVLAGRSLDESMRDDPLPGQHGVAWVVSALGEERLVKHSGSTLDYSSTILVLPDRGLAVIGLAAGPRVDLIQCAAEVLLGAAATRAPLRACMLDETSRRFASAAIAQLLTVLADPTPAAIDAAFVPGFLARVPASEIAQKAGELAQRVGRCAGHEIVGAGRRRAARAVLHCERGPVEIEIAAEDEPPHRIIGLRFTGP